MAESRTEYETRIKKEWERGWGEAQRRSQKALHESNDRFTNQMNERIGNARSYYDIGKKWKFVFRSLGVLGFLIIVALVFFGYIPALPNGIGVIFVFLILYTFIYGIGMQLVHNRQVKESKKT